MDTFSKERIRAAEEVILYLPDTIYTVTDINDTLTKDQIREIRKTHRRLKAAKEGRPHHAYRKYCKFAAGMLKRAYARVREMGYPLCEGGPGCNACCRRVVVLPSKLEKEVIIHAIRKMVPKEREILKKGLEHNEKIMKGVMLAYGVKGTNPPDDVAIQVGMTFSEVGGFCPALGPTGRCLIYSVRPWSCRAFRVLGDSCRPLLRLNIVRFPDIDATMISNLENNRGKTKTTLFPVIREALKEPRPTPALIPPARGV